MFWEASALTFLGFHFPSLGADPRAAGTRGSVSGSRPGGGGCSRGLGLFHGQLPASLPEVWLGSDPFLRLSSMSPSACPSPPPCPCSPRWLLPRLAAGQGMGKKPAWHAGPLEAGRFGRANRQPPCNLSHFTGENTESWRSSCSSNLSNSWEGSVWSQPHPPADIMPSGWTRRPHPVHSAWHVAGSQEPFTK